MTTPEYRRGFLDKLAEYEKSAKFRYEMTPEELRKSELAAAEDRKREAASVVRRNPLDPIPKNFGEELKLLGRKAGRKSMSLLRGAGAAAGVTGVRAAEGLAELATFVPSLADSILFGSVAGVNDGRGFLGKRIGNMHRFADKTVHNIRRWSDDYDYQNRINSPFNRFLHGVAADTAGSIIGFGGLSGIGKKGIARILPAVGGAFGAHTGIFSDQYKQLREREDLMRRLTPRYARYMDPTSTPYNQENAPTDDEYRRYHLPYKDLPTSVSGKIRVPARWRYSVEDGMPVQFRPYGE